MKTKRFMGHDHLPLSTTGLALMLAMLLAAACQPLALAPSTVVVSAVGATASAPATVSFEQTRQTADASLLQTQLALVETITPIAPPTGRPPTVTMAPFVPGIYPIDYAPFGVDQAQTITSQWRGLVNGERTYIYAGAHREASNGAVDTSKGLIGVVVYSADLSTSNTQIYDAAGTTGLLTITAEMGYRLTLSSESGATLYFDVPSRSFATSLTETLAAPTATLLPPSTATLSSPTSEAYPAPPLTPEPATSTAP